VTSFDYLEVIRHLDTIHVARYTFSQMSEPMKYNRVHHHHHHTIPDSQSGFGG
jgi:hypothetical protein